MEEALALDQLAPKVESCFWTLPALRSEGSARDLVLRSRSRSDRTLLPGLASNFGICRAIACRDQMTLKRTYDP